MAHQITARAIPVGRLSALRLKKEHSSKSAESFHSASAESANVARKRTRNLLESTQTWQNIFRGFKASSRKSIFLVLRRETTTLLAVAHTASPSKLQIRVFLFWCYCSFLSNKMKINLLTLSIYFKIRNYLLQKADWLNFEGPFYNNWQL